MYNQSPYSRIEHREYLRQSKGDLQKLINWGYQSEYGLGYSRLHERLLIWNE